MPSPTNAPIETSANRRSFGSLHVIRVQGTALERARTHARLMRPEILKGALPYLAKKNESLIRRAPGATSWKPLQDVVVGAYYNVLLRVLLSNTEPEMRDLMRILAVETGLSEREIQSALFQADGLMLLSRLSMMRSLMRDLPGGGLPGCSSMVALSGWGAETGMLAARNQDYPVVGYWEPQTTVVFHEPSESGELPHVAVTTAGVHTSGVTCMNAEGLMLFAHAHFGRKVSLRGKTVVELGSAIATRAKTLGQAVDLARKHRRHANWAFVVGSARENEAAVIEMTPSRTEVHPPTDGLLTHSNFFHHPELHAQEANLSGGCSEDLLARLCRMRALLTPLKGKLTPADLAAALGDHVDPNSGEERIFGNTLSVVTTIKSVVFDPSRQRLWVSTRGESPMALAADFMPIDVQRFWQTDGNADAASPALRGYQPKNPRLIEGVREYREAYRRWHTEPDRADYRERTLAALERTVAVYPEDGHVWLQLGMVAFHMSETSKAARAFQEALGRKLSPHGERVGRLYLARLEDLAGRRPEALRLYAAGVEGEQDPKIREAFQEGLRRPYVASRARDLMLDLQFPDSFAY